ncbi:MAG: hypothetical protein AAFN40_22515 [Cyanobacteria bacterium J06560_6]
MRSLSTFLSDTLIKRQTFSAFQASRLMMGYSFSLGLSFLIGPASSKR